MASYQIDTTPDQDAALAWCLAQQQAADPDNAPADVGALVAALCADRLNGIVAAYGEARVAELQARIAGAVQGAETAVQEKAAQALDALRGKTAEAQIAALDALMTAIADA
jgi:hypothetical protein